LAPAYSRNFVSSQATISPVRNERCSESHLDLRWSLIFNPNAGSAESDAEIVRLARSLPQCDVANLNDIGDAVSLARQAILQGAEGLIIAGGDGTIHAVVNAVADHLDSIVVAIIPMGTGNDLARSLGVPLEIEEAFELFRRGVRRHVDVVKMGCADHSRLVVNASAAGFSDAVGARVDPAAKSKWGSLAYIISAAAALPDLTSYQVRIDIDGHRLEIEVFNIVVANGRFIAGGIPIAPEALLNDGQLDVVILPGPSLTNAALAVPEILFGRHQQSDRVLTARARTLRIESNPPMRFNADGETACEGWAQFDLLQGALRIIAAPDAPAIARQDAARQPSH
jgi:diacylglycerol kinase (ATP)